ncbi:uncharacterized protein ColSpa_03014 [Colletotrichum spaethianum]|uniref:Uncharacterized protein n=1 Tax=Colletotrichum spaethianum TaxID=700344 RepID=A0AA37NZY8_9PEZI|nr:uncharacterized protein ColSpa_03014 [Colletotrichum spaethianum]GKT42833.1 hypothetical protein ColSpa_03014 [Colletotrichum spaethianum]
METPQDLRPPSVLDCYPTVNARTKSGFVNNHWLLFVESDQHQLQLSFLIEIVTALGSLATSNVV